MFANHDRYRLRWRFDFHNKPTKIGQWCRPADRQSDMACFQNGEGLVRASIEAQDVHTQEINTIAECDGHDFCNFQWVSAAWGFMASRVKIVGISLITRDVRCTVYVDGKTVVEDRTEDDKNFHFETYGR